MRLHLAIMSLGIAIGVIGHSVLLPAPALADVEPQMLLGVDMPGGDLAAFNLDVPDPGICRQACDQNGQCVAWTFVRPGGQVRDIARCWLKGSTGRTLQNLNTITGYKGGGGWPLGARVELTMLLGTDFPGSDIASFALGNRSDPNACQNACNGRPDCQAWTFVKPGVQGPQAMCYLKHSTPSSRFNNTTISGRRTTY